MVIGTLAGCGNLPHCNKFVGAGYSKRDDTVNENEDRHIEPRTLLHFAGGKGDLLPEEEIHLRLCARCADSLRFMIVTPRSDIDEEAGEAV
jgi:hypothetical protein